MQIASCKTWSHAVLRWRHQEANFVCVCVYLRRLSVWTLPIAFPYIPLSPLCTWTHFYPPTQRAHTAHAHTYGHTRTHTHSLSLSLCGSLFYPSSLLDVIFHMNSLKKPPQQYDKTWYDSMVTEAERTNARHGWIEEKISLVSNFITQDWDVLRNLYIFKTYIYMYAVKSANPSLPGCWEGFLPSRLWGFNGRPEHKCRSQVAWRKRISTLTTYAQSYIHAYAYYF